MYSERRNTSTGASLRRLDKMASCIQAARRLHDRRLHAGGMPSYTKCTGPVVGQVVADSQGDGP